MSKNHRLHFISLFVLVLALLSFSLINAQDSLDSQPLLKMLANIPNSSLSRTELYFNDRKAVEMAYPPAKVPKDWAEFKAMSDAKGKNAELLPVDIWWRVWRNQQSALTARYMMTSDVMPSLVGFDYFQIEQEMTYGTPPAQTLQLAGHFDLDAVRAAFSSRGYTRQDKDGLEMWCPADGCDSGMKLNMADRNTANPFGGELGRSQPLIIKDGTLISSPNVTVMQDHIDSATGNEQSLADLPQYRAVVDAFTADGSLMQAYFWDGELIAQMSLLSPVSVILGERATPELVKKYFQDLLKTYKPIPAYQLLAFADVASDSEQIGEVALVYSTEADAKAAAEVLPARINDYVSIAIKRPLTGMLKDRRVDEPQIDIVNSNGKYVVVIKLATRKATPEEIQQFDIANTNTPDVTAPGLVYRMLVSAAIQRDLGWLSTVSLADLEAAAK
ncbi:MAG: hypothetical protein GC179_09610 [Anaerolineaceae bacterium]|nr:hypothetical protein [Anaerolineaceae bacterium]